MNVGSFCKILRFFFLFDDAHAEMPADFLPDLQQSRKFLFGQHAGRRAVDTLL